MTQLDPCLACTARFSDKNDINDCCYNTCASFVDGDTSDIINSKCGQICKKCSGGDKCHGKLKVPVIHANPQLFKSCLDSVGGVDKKEALTCCIGGCRNQNNPVECQNRCINAYNALIPVKEGFLLPGKVNRRLLFLFAVIFFHLSLLLRWMELPKDQNKAIVYIIVLYVLIYYFTEYI